MKASKAIEILKGYSPDEEIYIMWWDSDITEMYGEDKLTTDQWNDIVTSMEKNDAGSEDVSEYLIYKIREANLYEEEDIA
jgi:hypothetical protein